METNLLTLTLPLSDTRSTLEMAGGKGASLARLAAAGLPVPGGFTVTTAAYLRFVEQNDLQAGILADLQIVDLARPSTLEEAARRIQARFLSAPIPLELTRSIATTYAELAETEPVEAGMPAVAVRSSATAEDLPEASFAGQQETYLNVTGEAAVLEATRKCWASLWTARAIAYRMRQGIEPGAVALAVVVQRMVAADAAGILFTANPVTGQRRELLVNAAWGLGEAIVGGLVTPDSFVLDKASGQVISREIADKALMTVRTASGTQEQAVPEALRHVPALDDAALGELARLAAQIEALYGMPMDIEWALSGGQIAILQARPITALPEEAPAEPKIEWTLPHPKGKYVRGSIADFMPDPLTPLYESMVVPAQNEALTRLMAKLGGGEMDMYRHFFLTINHYAYMTASFTTGEILQMVVRIFSRVGTLMKEGLATWRNYSLPRYQALAEKWCREDLAALSPRKLIAGIDELFEAHSYHLATLQVATLGTAGGSEGLFTVVYNKLVRREGDPDAPVFLMGFDSTPIQAEKSLYDLAQWAREQPGLAGYLSTTTANVIAGQSRTEQAPNGIDAAIWSAWRQRFQEHLERYGHTVYNLDFASTLPMDEPAPIIETVKLFLSGQGKDPYQRQQATIERREAANRAVQPRLKGPKAWAFRKALGWAQTYNPLREDSIAALGLGYPAIRKVLDELGERLVLAGALEQPGDIYWLERAEIDAVLSEMEDGQEQGRDSQAQSRTAIVRERQAERAALKRVSPPHQLPGKIKLMGIDTSSMMGVSAEEQQGNTMRGLGASPGQVTGVARVLNGPEDFDQMRPGDVLVASITTPAWTPLFAMASAVVTDIGGPLSHGSIVAREYGIPAVLGTGGATHRIQSGQRVTVDGTAGTVTLLQ